MEYMKFGFVKDGKYYIYENYIETLLEMNSIFGNKFFEIRKLRRYIVIDGVKMHKRGIFYITNDRKVLDLLSYIQ